jgi:hypothetical protein
VTTPEARVEALREALLTGQLIRDRLVENLNDVDAENLLSKDDVGELSKQQRRLTDSLALTFANLAGLIQDQIIRLILLLEEYDVTEMTRREQRLRAEAIGLVGPARHFERVAETRNRIAHQYPRDPVRQRRLLQDIAEQSRAAVTIFEDVRDYGLRKFVDARPDQ